VVPNFSLRTAGADDIDLILDQLEKVAEERKWISSEPPIPRDRYRESFEKWLDDEHALMVVAEADGELIGHLSAFGRENRPAEIGMAVAKEWRGRGVGTALMRRSVDWARERGVHKLALQVWPHNEAARRLYEKFGFVQEGLLRAHYRRQNGELWDAIVMGLLLE
jgi:RimJ/RimL family protein N-acetyltransferase